MFGDTGRCIVTLWVRPTQDYIAVRMRTPEDSSAGGAPTHYRHADRRSLPVGISGAWSPVAAPLDLALPE